ncbi:MAG: sulfatase-like hydrolase/transferase [Pirellulales bacterium]
MLRVEQRRGLSTQPQHVSLGQSLLPSRGPDAPATGPNFPTTLKQAGYETWHCGKRGNSAIPIQNCFEHNSYINENQARLSGKPGREITDAAIAFLDKRDAARPFFLYCGYETPHDPRADDRGEGLLREARDSAAEEFFHRSTRSITAR